MRPTTDTERVLEALRAAGGRGLHSHDIRRRGLSGNPSQRMSDLQDLGYVIEAQRENVGRRPGTRYFLKRDVGAGAGRPEGNFFVDSSGAGSGGAQSGARGARSGPHPSPDADGPRSAALFELPAESPQDPLRDGELEAA